MCLQRALALKRDAPAGSTRRLAARALARARAQDTMCLQQGGAIRPQQILGITPLEIATLDKPVALAASTSHPALRAPASNAPMDIFQEVQQLVAPAWLCTDGATATGTMAGAGGPIATPVVATHTTTTLVLTFSIMWILVLTVILNDPYILNSGSPPTNAPCRDKF